MATSNVSFVASGGESLLGICSDGLQESETWLAVDAALWQQQVLVNQRGDAVQQRRWLRVTTDGFDRLHSRPTGKYRESTEKKLLLGSQERVTPIDRCAERLLSFRRIQRTRG